MSSEGHNKEEKKQKVSLAQESSYKFDPSTNQTREFPILNEVLGNSDVARMIAEYAKMEFTEAASLLRQEAAKMRGLIRNYPHDRVRLVKYAGKITDIGDKINGLSDREQNQKVQINNTLDKFDYYLRRYAMIEGAASRTAYGLYFASITGLYCALWVIPYAVANENPMAIFESIQNGNLLGIQTSQSLEIAAIVLGFVLSLTCIGLIKYIDSNRDDSEPKNFMPLNVNFIDPFSSENEYQKILKSCQDIVESCRPNCEISNKQKLIRYLYKQSIVLNAMKSKFCFDSPRLNTALDKLQDIIELLRDDNELNVHNTKNFLMQSKNAPRNASVFSIVLYWPLVSTTIVLGVAEIISLFNDDPMALFHMSSDNSIFLGFFIFLCAIVFPAVKIKMCDIGDQFNPNPPDWLDPLSDQKQYTKVLQNCIDELDKLYPQDDDLEESSYDPSSSRSEL